MHVSFLLNPQWTPSNLPGHAGHHTFWRILSRKRTNFLFLSSKDARMRNTQLPNGDNSSPGMLEYETYPEDFFQASKKLTPSSCVLFFSGFPNNQERGTHVFHSLWRGASIATNFPHSNHSKTSTSIKPHIPPRVFLCCAQTWTNCVIFRLTVKVEAIDVASTSSGLGHLSIWKSKRLHLRNLELNKWIKWMNKHDLLHWNDWFNDV